MTGVSHLFLDLRTGDTRPLPDVLAGGGLFFALSPDGSRFTYNSCCSRPQPGFVATVDGARIRTVTPPGVDAFGMRWSPDGTQLVFQGRDATTVEIGNIFTIDLASGATTRVTDLPKIDTNGYWFASPTFGPDGDTITYSLPTDDGSGWNTWSQKIGRSARTLFLENASYARYSPDGTQVAYLHAPGALSADELWVADADGSDAHRLLAGNDIVWPTWSPDGSRIALEMRDPAATEPTPISSVYVVDAGTGDTTKVAEGWDANALGVGGTALPEWFNNHTLIVGPSSIPDEPSAVVVPPES
jgi:Tol biopolymer transport system component